MSRLEEVGPGLWHVEQHHYPPALHVRVRMVVARLRGGGLWLHSAVELDEELRAQLAELGPVEHLVAPNLGHTKWAADAKARYPDAVLWGAPGMRAAHPEVPTDRELGEDPPWARELVPQRLAGTPKVNEVVFLHPPTRTLVCTDLLLHVQHEPRFLTRLLYRSIGVWRRASPASVWKGRTKDRAAARASYDAVLGWDFDRILMAHGDPIEEDARDRLQQALAWCAPG